MFVKNVNNHYEENSNHINVSNAFSKYLCGPALCQAPFKALRIRQWPKQSPCLPRAHMLMEGVATNKKVIWNMSVAINAMKKYNKESISCSKSHHQRESLLTCG